MRTAPDDPGLASTHYIDARHENVLAELVRLKIDGLPSAEKARRIFLRVRDGIAYTPMVPLDDPGHFKASFTLSQGYGFCVQKAVVFAALCRAAGLPCRLRFADIRSHRISPSLYALMGTDVFVFHGYNEVRIDGKWVQATPAFEKKLCDSQGFRTIDFDGRNHALLPSTDLAGRPHFEYLRYYEPEYDLPLERILADIVEAYGTRKLKVG